MKEIEQYPHLKEKINNVRFEEARMQFDLEIDSSYHDYLNEHIFDEKFYLPATFIVEIMMEAAKYNLQEECIDINQQNVLWEMDELEIYRAVKRKSGDKLTVTCTVTRYHVQESIYNAVVEIHSDRVNKSGQKVGRCLNAKSKVVLKAENSYQVFESKKIELEDYGYYDIESTMIYKEYYSGLGERFKNCTYNILVDQKLSKMHGFYNCNGSEVKCINRENQEFITSPLGNDACLQYAIFLSRLNNGLGELPIGCEKIQFVRKPSHLQNVKVYIRINQIDDEKTYFDIYSYDEMGICVYFKDFISKKTIFQKKMEHQFIDELLADSKKESCEVLEEWSYYEWKACDFCIGL